MPYHKKQLILQSYKPKSKERACRDTKAYAMRHPERIKERWQKWYNENKEERLKRKYERDKSPERQAKQKAWREKNRDKINERRRTKN